MHASRQNLFTRDDTFFGVCEGLGEDFRIPANLLRLGFTLALFFYPLAALGAYAGAGMAVLVSRLLVPTAHPPAARAARAPGRLEAAADAAAADQPALAA